VMHAMHIRSYHEPAQNLFQARLHAYVAVIE
jgi:hypothetical protein